MKINIIFLFTSLFFIALLKNAHSGLVSGIVGKIHSTVHKINEDVHKMLLPKEKIYQGEVTSDNKQNVDAAHTVNSNNENSETKIIVATTETTEEVKNKSNPVIASPIKPHDARHETEIKEDTAEKTFVFATSSSTIAPVSTTTVKEGRENFAAGCTTGYKRTADGRCKPTF